MAEIHVKKKDNKGPVWPWILGVLLVLGLVAWWIIGNTDSEPEREIVQTEVTQPVDTDRAEEGMYTSNPVAAFINFVEENNGQQEAGLYHEYTSTGLQRLESALSDLSNQAGINDEANVRQYRDRMENMATKIQQDPQSTQHANMIHDAFAAASDWMQLLEQRAEADANDEVSQVRQAVEKINPQELTLNQKDAIDNFFTDASDALEAMTSVSAANR